MCVKEEDSCNSPAARNKRRWVNLNTWGQPTKATGWSGWRWVSCNRKAAGSVKGKVYKRHDVWFECGENNKSTRGQAGDAQIYIGGDQHGLEMNTSEIQLRSSGLDTRLLRWLRFYSYVYSKMLKGTLQAIKDQNHGMLKKTVGKDHKMKKSTIQNQAEQTCWCKELHFEHGFFLLVLYVKMNLCLLLLCMSSKWQCCLSKHWWRRHLLCGFFWPFFPSMLCQRTVLSEHREHGL